MSLPARWKARTFLSNEIALLHTLPQQFLATAERFAAKCALKYKRGDAYEELTYAEVAQGVSTVAAALMGLGVQPADRIALLAENRPEWVMADLGIMLAGGITVPIHTTFSARLIAEVLKSSGARILIVSHEALLRKALQFRSELPDLSATILMEGSPSPLEGLSCLSWTDFLNHAQTSPEFPSMAPDALCTIIFTSGTTGEPKGVMLTHRNLLSNARAAHQAVPVSSEDVALSFLPLSHIYERTGGHYVLLLFAGAAVAYAKSLKELPENLREARPTLLVSVPRFFDQIYDRTMQEMGRRSALIRSLFWGGLKAKRGSLRHLFADALIFRKIRARLGGRLHIVISGGAGLNPKVGEFFAQIGIPIREGYGLTETSPVIAVNRPDRIKIGTVGTPLEGVQVQIAADGEILVKGEGNTPGYWKDDQATRELIDPAGWLHTGDLGGFDEDGLLKILGRKKELLVTAGGKNVWPEALEARLNASPFIAQSMVVGDGERYLSALIVPDRGNLRDFVRKENIPDDGGEGWLNHRQILALYRKEIDLATQDLAAHEKIAKFKLLAQEFSFDREELTPTLKIRRKIIAQHYREEIQKLYRGRATI
jgi:long-chain acyl-CoA synthetase